jgi:hypothetical protein
MQLGKPGLICKEPEQPWLIALARALHAGHESGRKGMTYNIRHYWRHAREKSMGLDSEHVTVPTCTAAGVAITLCAQQFTVRNTALQTCT